MRWLSRASQEKDLTVRIEQLLENSRNEPDTAFTFERLRELTHATSSAELVIAIQELVEGGKLRTIVRVESPIGKGGIQDFDSTNNLPHEIFDWRSGKQIEISPENVRVLYALPRAQ